MQVKIQNGLLRGAVHGEIAEFLGIPYAKPPVGDLRWKAPQEPDSWDGVRDALEVGNASLQPVTATPGLKAVEEPISEDCLYLNVWAPKSAMEEDRRLPVLVIIHGGGFQAFSGAYDILRGGELAKQEIVVVSINYRLGVMGFFAHPELSAENPAHVSGNYGILDQIAALKWVQKNIAAFGGDPEKVTVSGESAGAFSVSVLCMSPLSKGLFRAATAQSGGFFDRRGAIYETYTLAEVEATCAAQFPGKSLEQLRAMPGEELMQQTMSIGMTHLKPLLDGYVFPAEAGKLYADGSFRDVPLLLGSNCDDGAQFTTCSGDPAELDAIGRALAGEKNLAEFRALYPSVSREEGIRSQIQLTSDMSFGHNAYVWSSLHTRYGSAPVYLYYYCHVPPESQFGAHHSSELPYFFHNLHCRQKPYTQTDYRLEEEFSSYLVNFVKTGDPNGADLPRWAAFRADPEQIMRLDEKSGMIPNPTLTAMRFWDRVMPWEA